jgi:hypothetical protein
MGGVSARYAHNERKKETYKSNPDINHTAKADNYHLISPQQTYLREVKRLIKTAGCKVRSNSVVMVEALVTATPEFIKPLKPEVQYEFFERALKFIESRIGRKNIISAVVHMDEKTPHMHLTFCPITKDNCLSAKEILGNRAKLSKWQDDYHKVMSERWSELERGISAQITHRKHLPVGLFKAADRLDEQYLNVVKALADINPLNAKSKRDKGLQILEKWMPEAIKFTARIKEVDHYIRSLEKAEKETVLRIKEIEDKGNERVHSTKNTLMERINAKDDELAEKDKKILEAQREAYQSADTLRRQMNSFERLIGRLPLEMRDRLYAEKQAMENSNNMKGRGKSR